LKEYIKYIYIYICVCVCVCMYVCMYVCVRTCVYKSVITGEMANFILANSTWNTFEYYLIHTERVFFNVKVSFTHKERTRVWCSHTIAVFISPSTVFHAKCVQVRTVRSRRTCQKRNGRIL